MTNERFWEIVDFVNWPRDDYKEVEAELLFSLSPNEVNEFRDELDRRTSKVGNAFDETYDEADADFYVSGDGFSDLKNHVVGRGKSYYEDRLENPEKLLDDMRENNFVESFSYAIPYRTDYEKIGQQYYRYRSSSYVDRFQKIADTEKFAESYREKAKWLANAMDEFPNVKPRWFDCDGEDELLDRLVELEEDLSDDVKGVPVKNLVRDYRRYCVYGPNDR